MLIRRPRHNRLTRQGPRRRGRPQAARRVAQRPRRVGAQQLNLDYGKKGAKWTGTICWRSAPTRTSRPTSRASCSSNILFTKELARRLAGTGVTSVALHPGFVATELFRDHGDRSWVGFFQHMFINSLWMLSKKASDGAATSIFCATDPSVLDKNGLYFEYNAISKSRHFVCLILIWALKTNIQKQNSECKVKASSPASNDMDSAAKLWTVSEQLVASAKPWAPNHHQLFN